MASPAGYSVLMELRAARAWQVRPSEFQTWSRRDRIAATSLLQYEETVGPCGHSHLNTTGDLEGWFEVRADTFCWACAALEEFKKSQAEHIPPGALLRIVNTKNEKPEE